MTLNLKCVWKLNQSSLGRNHFQTLYFLSKNIHFYAEPDLGSASRVSKLFAPECGGASFLPVTLPFSSESLASDSELLQAVAHSALFHQIQNFLIISTILCTSKNTELLPNQSVSQSVIITEMLKCGGRNSTF